MFDSNRFRMAFLIGLVAISLAALPVAAQDDPEVTDEMIEQAMERSFEGEVTVTGSLIPRADLTALSPVTVMEVPQELTYSGTVRIEDLITTMPQAFAGQNSTIANGASGIATVSLRDLGPQRTLVLINGRRMAPGDPWQGSYSFAPDLNAVPAPLIKRVDVLTGGASTAYGSDAVAGVVNFVMDTDFEGVRGGLQYAFYNHDNNNQLAQDINTEAGFDVPSGMTNDGDSINANIALGGKFADGKGHAAVYLDYRKLDALTKGARDYVNCSVSDGATGPECGGSSTSPMGRFRPFDIDGNSMGDHTIGADGHSFVPGFPIFNYGPYNHIQRPDEKFNAGAFANYEINKHFDVYMEVMYMNNYTDAQIAPSGNFNVYTQINCDNPMLSDQQYQLVCVDGGYGPTDIADSWILRRNVEGIGRTNQLGHNNIRLLGGLRGELNDEWSYDFYWLRAMNNSNDSYVNDLSIQRVGNALDVIEDPDTGEWVCRSGSGDGCVPWNIFRNDGTGMVVDDYRLGVTQEAIDYISTVAVQYGNTVTQVFNLTFKTDWENYGIAIPSASEGLQAAMGLEYREEWMANHPDNTYQTADAAGFGGETPQVEGAYNVKEAFIELLVPIVQDAKGFQDLSLELGYRYSDYSTSGGASTYKAQLSWAPTQSWRLRGGYNRAVRAPNIWELFSPQTFGLGGSADICSGPNPSATEAQCANTGVLPGQYGNIAPNPADQYNTFGGGNPFLDPETADTITAGIVWTPQSIRGLSITVDYYNIAIEDTIGSLGADDIIQTCATTGDPSLCELIHRDSQGTLWATQAAFTETNNQNIGQLDSEGVDLNFNYLLGLGNSGYLAMDLMGSYLLKQNFSNPLVDYDCVGYFGFQCGTPQADWRHRFRATWETNFRLNISLAWRYVGEVEVDDASDDSDIGDPGAMENWRINGIDKISAYNWFDLAASYTFRNGIKLTLGVNNILDEEPPLAPTFNDDFGVNLYATYDPLGRYIFSSIQFNF